tara:strand:- start:4706 stop:4861 length:156 start_codon:yes stop_codon:yes gene_type:complete
MNTQKVINKHTHRINKTNRAYTKTGQPSTQDYQNPNDLVAIPKQKEVDGEE